MCACVTYIYESCYWLRFESRCYVSKLRRTLAFRRSSRRSMLVLCHAVTEFGACLGRTERNRRRRGMRRHCRDFRSLSDTLPAFGSLVPVRGTSKGDSIITFAQYFSPVVSIANCRARPCIEYFLLRAWPTLL